jgi:methyl-accepting chemotaxis protein
MIKTMRNFRVSVKTLLPLVLLATLALAAGGYSWNAMQTSNAAYTDLLEREETASLYASRLTRLASDLARLTWRSIAFPEPEIIAAVIHDLEGLPAEAAAFATRVRPAVVGTPEAAALATYERNFPAAHAAALSAVGMMQDPARAEAARQLMATEVRPIVDTLRPLARGISAAVEEHAKAHLAAVTAASDAAGRTALIVLVVAIIGSLTLAVLVTTLGVVRPLRALVSSIQRLAGGDLNAAANLTESTDEIGTMAQALRTLAAALGEAAGLRAEQETIRQRGEASRKAALAEMATTLESSVGAVVDSIASAATELNVASGSMVQTAEATNARAATVATATLAASGNVNTVAAATEELAASVAEISRQVTSSARMAGAAVEQVNRTNATVTALSEAAARIGEVTRLIGDIAGQTNLLALNATIEAARAGESGKGFAVVASEVKALANQTAQATGNIAQQIQAMQAATNAAVSEISAIRDSIGQVNEVTAAIAAAVEEQGAATRDIAQNVQRAAAGTTEIAGAIDGVTAAVGETTGAASQVQSTSAALAEQAETLRAEVGGFLVRVRAA